ncbi:hypothetical protein QR680_017253 [Steinernema hermaphroditum]|uniref:Uncharacterized protein n=1 Tax=Steinernema hermaphroditum TaxID=289476 RepID=A0AA39HF28_9BILA|nr:hypothetical protein QR680_017253 [Steinernema hermaphroditum]
MPKRSAKKLQQKLASKHGGDTMHRKAQEVRNALRSENASLVKQISQLQSELVVVIAQRDALQAEVTNLRELVESRNNLQDEVSLLHKSIACRDKEISLLKAQWRSQRTAKNFTIEKLERSKALSLPQATLPIRSSWFCEKARAIFVGVIDYCAAEHDHQCQCDHTCLHDPWNPPQNSGELCTVYWLLNHHSWRKDISHVASLSSKEVWIKEKSLPKSSRNSRPSTM